MGKNFLPNYYFKTIFDINFHKFSSYDVIAFDYDNTLAPWNKTLSPETINLLKKLSKNFKLYIFTNGSLNRVEANLKMIDIKCYGLCLKPFTKKIKQIVELKRINVKRSLFIGDNVLTDIWTANRIGFTTVLVEPQTKKEHFLTTIWRFLEKIFRLRRKAILKAKVLNHN